MNARHTCEEVQLLAPEVALGIASGDERALVLAHAKTCGDCRRVLEELSATADALLGLGPSAEPSSGFESTVLAHMQPELRFPSRMRSKLIAAALAAVLATGAIAFAITSDDRKVANYYRQALEVANGEYFTVVELQSRNGDRAGHMFAYEGHPTWVMLIFATPLEPGRYEAALETTAAIRSLGAFEIGTNDATWGRDLPVGLGDVRSVRVLDDRGTEVLRATFTSQ